MSALGSTSTPDARARPERGRPRVVIGLINNMGDQALKTTERQYGGLLAEAGTDVDLEIRIFALGATRRSLRALDYIHGRYEPVSAVAHGELHGLIVTGAQPQTDHLTDEAYWDELVELIEWARSHTISTILSCLAAHAAVLHLDGIERRPLAEKCFGVFSFATQEAHPLVGRKGAVRLVPHSRHNGLSKYELEQAGYAILTSSAQQGVDIFTKDFDSKFVFLQGHPEYASNSLAREYRRDMALYLRHESDRKPAAPTGYFRGEAEVQLSELELRFHRECSGGRTDDLSRIDSLAPSEATWRTAAVSFYRNWIDMMARDLRRRCVPLSRQEAPDLASWRYA